MRYLCGGFRRGRMVSISTLAKILGSRFKVIGKNINTLDALIADGVKPSQCILGSEMRGGEELEKITFS